MHFNKSESTPALRWLPFQAFDDDAVDNYAPKTGLTWGVGELKVAKAGAGWADAAGTTANGQVIEIGGGWYWYQFSAAELDTQGAIMLIVNKTDVYSEGTVGFIPGYDPHDAVALGLSNLATAVPAIADWLDAADSIETGLTLRNALRLLAAYAAGNVTGGGSGTEAFKAAVDSAQTRFTSFPTSAGSRTVTYDFS